MPDLSLRRILAIVVLVGISLLGTSLVARAEVVRLGDAEYASLQGHVYADLNRNTEMDAGEGLISDVVIHCTLTSTSTSGGSSGSTTPVIYTTTTNEYGFYSFTGLAAGTYTLTEEDPVEFMQGLAHDPGTVGGVPVGEADGPDSFVSITLVAGDKGINYNFGESGLRSAYLSKRHLLTYKKEIPVIPVPEPGLLALSTMGLLACCLRRRAGRK